VKGKVRGMIKEITVPHIDNLTNTILFLLQSMNIIALSVDISSKIIQLPYFYLLVIV
jgi:hypothetical protein